MASLHNHTHHPPLLRLTPQAPSETASDPSTSEFIFMILSAPPFKLPFAIQFWSNNETIFLSQDSFICLNFFWTPINHKCPFIWYAKDQHRPLAIHIHRKKPQHETTHLILFITWVFINVLRRDDIVCRTCGTHVVVPEPRHALPCRTTCRSEIFHRNAWGCFGLGYNSTFPISLTY